MCGGTGRKHFRSRLDQGLSPRVRGNHRSLQSILPDGRSIPACAGEPTIGWLRVIPTKVYPRVCGGTTPGRLCRHRQTVYPRVCGGTWLQVTGADVSEGLSPRVRGNRGRLASRLWPGGSIPACAGEPPVDAENHPGETVYPRVCGGTIASIGDAGLTDGLSPRVRGNRTKRNYLQAVKRSIPACAGEPAQMYIIRRRRD